MKLLISITIVVAVVNAQRIKRGELSFGGEFSHGDFGGHEIHGVATSYQNVHLESHNPVPVVVHKEIEHHGISLEGHSGSGLEGLGHGFSVEEHGGLEGHGLELHGFHGHEGIGGY